MDALHTPIEIVGSGFEAAGVAVLVVGSLMALVAYAVTVLHRRNAPAAHHTLRSDLGRSILLGLEFLVAADIIRSVAVTPTLQSVIVLGIIVLIRTFLSWSLEVEINGEWPWLRHRSHPAPPVDSPEDSGQS